MSAVEYLELGKSPIREGAPCGESCRDDQDFESLQLEIRKLELPDAPQPDWQKAAQLASSLLRDRSKDLLVASWLTIALFHREGYGGFDAGLTVLRDMVELHWDTLFPEAKRMKGRLAAVEWVLERGTREVQRRAPSTNEREAVDACLARLKELDDKLSDRVADGGPSPADLRRALEDAASMVKAPPAPSAAPAASSTSTAAAPATITSAADIPNVLGTARSILRSVTEFLRTNEPTNPLIYRLPRLATWMHLIAPPPNQDGLTQIPAPQPPESGEKLESMLAAGQWMGVLEQTESRLATAVFWLDLHRYAAQALEGLGPTHAACAQAVVEEVAQLLRRFPTLKDFRFKEGQPLANAATQRWLSERVLVGGGGDAGAPAPSQAGGEEVEGLAEAAVEARGLAQQRRVPEALAMLEDGARTARSLRARARWTLEMARLCLAQNLAETAYQTLEGLDAEMARASADDWDPPLSAEILKSLFQSHQKVISSLRPIPPEELQRSRLLLGRLSRLDVVAAAALEPKRV